MSKEDKPEEKTEEKEEDFKSKWNTEQQRADQEHANYEKAVAENQAIADQLEATTLKVKELEKQIAAKEEKKDEIELDPDLVDKNVIKEITRLKSDSKKEQARLTELQAKVTAYEEKEKKKEADAAQQRVVDKVLSQLDDEFGAKHRNAAYKLASKLVDNGKEPKPDDQIEAYLLMRKCYKEVSEKDKPKPAVRTDTGGGGVTVPANEKKTGTLEEVLADMKKDKSWKE